MNFKKPKHMVIEDAYSAARMHISVTLSNRLSGDPGPQAVRYAIEQAVAEGIREAIRVLVESTYTDVEFEQDIGLKS